MERADSGELRRRRGMAAAIVSGALLIALSGCRAPGKSFGAMLARIDADPERAADSLYITAASLASGTEDRLRLLKRASGRPAGSYAAIASAVVAAGAVTEPVALAALDAFLAAGRYEEALALFDGPLDDKSRPKELAEALTLAILSGAAVRPDVERLVACADVTGDGRFLVYAAADAMLAGDRATALALLSDSIRSDPGARQAIPYRLLWDAGAVDILADRRPDPRDPLEIAVIADAERARGYQAAANASYAHLVERFPGWSWKPYAALARLAAAGQEESALPWPHAPASDSWTVAASPRALAERLYGAVAERFPDSAEATLDRARWLQSVGRFAEALSETEKLQGEAAAIARLAYGYAERAEPDALRLAAEYPSSPAAMDAALAALAKAGAWKRFSEIAEKSLADGLQMRRAWFWRAASSALAGDAAEAAETIRRYGPSAAGYAGAYDIGILELAAARPQIAAGNFLVAAGLARDGAEKAEAFVLAGDAFRQDGQTERAKAAYEAALGADQGSRDARSRLLRMSLSD